MSRIFVWLVLPLGLMALSGCGLFDSGKTNRLYADPSHTETLLRIAQSSEAAGDLDTAEHMYKQMASATDTAKSYRELAAFYKRHDQPQAAAAALEKAHDREPENIAIQRELANLYILSGSPQKALPLLDHAIASDGKNAFLYNSRGVALDKLGRYEEARKSYRTALSLDPLDIMTFSANLSMSYILSNEPQKAVTLLLPLMSSPEVTPTLRQNLALAYGLQGKNELALKLGLHDLDVAQANENLKFYRMLSGDHKDHKARPSQIPVSALEVFPEEATAQKTAPVIAVTQSAAGQTVQVIDIKPVVIKKEPLEIMRDEGNDRPPAIISATPQAISPGVSPEPFSATPTLKPDRTD